MDNVNLGLIGFGGWPREAYVPNLRQLPAANVVAVAAPTEASREAAREEFGGETALYADYHDLLGDDNVEAVMVALPNDLHAVAIEAVVAADKHIFFEPPLGLNAAEGRASLAALASTDRVVHADHELRYTPVIDYVRQKLGAGDIGDLLMAKIRLWCDWGHGGGTWRADVQAEGFFFWLGCWYMDALDAVLGEAPLSATVVGGRAMNAKLTDHGWATLTYPSGRVGQLEFSLVAVEGQEVSLHLAGTQGEMVADLWSGSCRWRRQDGSWEETIVECAQPPHGFAGMRESIAAFLSAVSGDGPTRSGLEVSRRVHQAVLACHQSMEEGGSVAAEEM